MATYVQIDPTQKLEPFKAVKKIPLEEYFTSGHRTCQGCESALVMKMMAKAAGPRTIVLGSTGCMYVANTTYYSTSWVIPWMHTQLGSSGSAAMGSAAGLKAQMRKGKMKSEPIHVIAFCGDGGGADMGLSAISAALTHPDYNLLILMYDNQEAVCCAERAVGDGRGRGGHARGGGKPGLSGAAWGGGAYGERMRCGRRTRGAPGVRPETAERSGVPRGRVGGGSEWRTRSATTSVGGGWP